MARPSDYTAETAAFICEQIALGLSIRAICAGDDMPAMSTIFKWLDEHVEFSEQYARAREAQADTLADELLLIADASGGDVQRDRLKIDTRKWIASKLKPKKYGEKVTNEHSGPGGDPIKHVHEIALVAIDATEGRATS